MLDVGEVYTSRAVNLTTNKKLHRHVQRNLFRQ